MNKKSILLIVQILLLAAVVATGVYFWLNTEKKAPKPKPYQHMIEVLTNSGMNAKQRFDGLFIELVKLQKIVGWRVKGIRLKEAYAMYFLERLDGDSTDIHNWPHINEFQLVVDHQGTSLLTGIRVIPPMEQLQVMDINELALYVEDIIRFVMPDVQISYLEDKKQPDHTERELQIVLKGTPALDLYEIGTLLDGLPISFGKAELLSDQQSLLSGEVSLVLLGV